MQVTVGSTGKMMFPSHDAPGTSVFSIHLTTN